jgi:hypothetical protein
MLLKIKADTATAANGSRRTAGPFVRCWLYGPNAGSLVQWLLDGLAANQIKGS